MKTLLALIFAGTIQFATAETTTSIVPDTDTSTVLSGTAIGDIALTSDMTWGKFSTSSSLGEQADLRGGDFYAGDYTLSMWVDLKTLSGTTTLFGYSGTVGSKPSPGYGANGLVYDANNKTFAMGGGIFSDEAAGEFTISRGATSIALDQDVDLSMLNLSLSVRGISGLQEVELFINGVFFNKLRYNGNMNGNRSAMNTWLNTNVTYGKVDLVAGKKLSAEEIPALAGFRAVPEPTTASLGLLGMMGLIMRRRRI